MTDLKNRTFRRILIVKLSSIGDVAMATPIPRGLRDLYPDAQIDWVVEPLSADVVRGNPNVNEVIVWDRSGSRAARGLRSMGRFAAEVRSLRARLGGRYDLAIDLQGLGRSALVMLASGAGVRIGKRDSREGSRFALTHAFTLRDIPAKAAAHYTELLRHLGHPNPPTTLEIYPDAANVARADALLNGLEDVPGGIVAVAPATTRPYKHWTNAAWAEALDLLHHDFGLTPAILGAKKDAEMAEDIAARCRSARPLLLPGQTTLRDAAEIIRRARLLTAVDTGLMHFGMAVNTPTVAVFGPTSAARFDDEPLVRYLQRGGCRQRGALVGRRKGWWDDRSIEQNTPEDVLAAAHALLDPDVEKAGDTR